MEKRQHTKKLNTILFIFILLVAFIFDIIGLIPFLSPLLFVFFTLLVKVQLWLSGYHASLVSMILSFGLNFISDLLMPLWFACTASSLIFYIFNTIRFKAEQKLLNSEEHELA